MASQSSAPPLSHVPVLLAPVLQGLAVKPDGIYLDGTFGRGGHARRLLALLGPQGRLLAMDKDPRAIEQARELAASDPRVAVRQGSFALLGAWDQVAVGLDGVLFDLGVSSPQLDDPERGFSFRADGPLDMRMDPGSGSSAADFINHAGEQEIAQVLWHCGEERQAKRIARAIVLQRGEQPFVRTTELAELVARLLGRGDGRIHPATRCFQALRIHVNHELEDLQDGLAAAVHALKAGGRLVVLSFHSLEDRITKQFIVGQAKPPPNNRRRPDNARFVPRLRIIGAAVRADAGEIAANPRARSAVLRVAEKCP